MMLLGFIGLLLVGCKQESKSYNGYVDADLVYLSADYAGRLTDLAVQRGQLVKKNDFLFKLEQTSEEYDLEMSKLTTKDLLAQRQQILAQLHFNEINYFRTLGMRRKNAASQNDLDMALRDLDVSKQQLADIDAKIDSNKIESKYKQWKVLRKERFAPESGLVFDTYYTKSEYVQGGYPILSLITKEHIKAVFFVPEPKLSRIRLNQKVIILTELGGRFAKGHINYISNIAEYTPPIIYSREESARLVFRVEAKIDAPNLQQVHLGLPVLLELET